MIFQILFNLLFYSFFVSSVFCVELENKEVEPVRLLSSRLENQNSASTVSQSLSDIETTILSLLPHIRGHVLFKRGSMALDNAMDDDSIDYCKKTKAFWNIDVVTDAVIKSDVQTTALFLDHLYQSLESFLQLHARVKNKDNTYFTLMRKYLIDLWKEINEASNLVRDDIARFLVWSWQRKDPKWQVRKTDSGYGIGYRGNPAVEVPEQQSLLKPLLEGKFTQVVSAQNQKMFYELCDENNITSFTQFEELMLYQKINTALISHVEIDQEITLWENELGEIMRRSYNKPIVRVHQASYDYLGSLSTISFKLNGTRPLISQIKDAVCSELSGQQPPIIDNLLVPLTKFVKDKEKRAHKRRQYNAARKARDLLKQKDLENVPTPPASVTPPVVSLEENELKSGEAAELTPDSSGSEEVPEVDSASVQRTQKLPKVEGDALPVDALPAPKFPQSTFVDVVLGHQKGTINTRDFKEFLGHVGGKMEKPCKGMTKYTLPNQGPDKDRYPYLFYHVDLPHGRSEPCYPAILYHHIRPSVLDAGFTLDMFG